MTRHLLIAIAAALLCWCVVTLDPTSSGVSVQTSAPFPVTSNTVAAASIGTAIAAGCALLGLPIPQTAATGGVLLLISVWAWIRRRRNNAKVVRTKGGDNE